MRDTTYTRAQVLKMLQEAGVHNPEAIINGGKNIIRCHADEADFMTVEPVKPKATAFDVSITEDHICTVTLTRATTHDLIDALYQRLSDL